MIPTFVQNIAAGVDKLGVEHAPVIFSLAQVRYDSPEERDSLFDYFAGGAA